MGLLIDAASGRRSGAHGRVELYSVRSVPTASSEGVGRQLLVPRVDLPMISSLVPFHLIRPGAGSCSVRPGVYSAPIDPNAAADARKCLIRRMLGSKGDEHRSRSCR